MTVDLFAAVPDVRPPREAMADGAVLLRGFVKPYESELIASLREIIAQAPFRRMFTPGGHQMSVAMTNCGEAGWVTDHTGYRYDGIDPNSAKPWPAMPPVFLFESMDDQRIDPQNSVLFADALRRGGVPADAHLFAHGVHGSGLSVGIEEEERWPGFLFFTL